MMGESRQTKNTPAVTIVAACISAETGVGPSMASGSHICKKSCADFPIAPRKNRKAMNSIALNSIARNVIELSDSLGAATNKSLNCKEPTMRKELKIAIARPKSPALFTTNAFIAALFALPFL